jgi:hypothetical protein
MGLARALHLGFLFTTCVEEILMKATRFATINNYLTQMQSWWRASDLRRKVRRVVRESKLSRKRPSSKRNWHVPLAACAGPTDAELSDLEKEHLPLPYEFVDFSNPEISSGLTEFLADRPVETHHELVVSDASIGREMGRRVIREATGG